MKDESEVGGMHQSHAKSDNSNVVQSRSRSPLRFFLLVFAFSVPFWMLGALVDVKGLPQNLTVSDLVLTFVPLIAASILVYGEEKLDGVSRLLKRIFDYKRIEQQIQYDCGMSSRLLIYLAFHRSSSRFARESQCFRSPGVAAKDTCSGLINFMFPTLGIAQNRRIYICARREPSIANFSLISYGILFAVCF